MKKTIVMCSVIEVILISALLVVVSQKNKMSIVTLDLLIIGIAFCVIITLTLFIIRLVKNKK